MVKPELARKWLEEEWKRVLSEHYPRARFPMPVLVLDSGGNVLGCWYGLPQNTLALNVRLLEEHPWYAVLEVFRHEMAHALNDYLHPLRNESAHGPFFREICREIGANPSATVEEISLDDRVFADGAPQEDSITAKIRKLLTLANAATDNEAEVALCKAQALMARYGMAEENLQEEEYTTITVGEPVKRLTAERKMLSALLQKFWPVQLIWGLVPPPAAVRNSLENYHQLYVCGTLENVRIVSYVHDFISHRIDTEFRLRFASRGLLARDRKQFSVGVLDGLYRALEEQSAKEEEQYALVLQKPAALNRYYASRFARIRSLRNAYEADGKAFQEGRGVGEKMTISPGLEGTGRTETRYLGRG